MARHLERALRPFKRLWRGARWSEYYGSHPGNVPLVVMIVAGGIAGSDRDPVWGPLLGSGVMAALFGPLWLRGCWDRGKLPKGAPKGDTDTGADKGNDRTRRPD